MVKRLLTIVIVSALIGVGYYIYLSNSDPLKTKGDITETTKADVKTEESSAAAEEETAKPALGGAPFSLTDQNGKTVTDKDLLGKKTLVFFGFTNCPDICPVSMAVITEVMNQLESAGTKNVIPVFITVDPGRDTPEVIKTYLADYYPGFIGLTGSEEELEKVNKAYKVYAEKAATSPEEASHEGHTANYSVSHSDLIYYMDENGKFSHHFNRDNAPEDIVDYISSH